MKSIFVEPDRKRLLARAETLSPESKARWGTLDVCGMLRHLDLCTLMALGDLPVRPAGKWAFTVFPLKHLLLYVVPFPKGAPTASELVPSGDKSFGAARAALVARIQLLAKGPSDGAGPVHPFFGPLSRKEWGLLVHKHSDHHLRQFGV